MTGTYLKADEHNTVQQKRCSSIIAGYVVPIATVCTTRAQMEAQIVLEKKLFEHKEVAVEGTTADAN